MEEASDPWISCLLPEEVDRFDCFVFLARMHDIMGDLASASMLSG